MLVIFSGDVSDGVYSSVVMLVMVCGDVSDIQW